MFKPPPRRKTKARPTEHLPPSCARRPVDAAGANLLI
jgi:hypothetical protein